MAETELNYGDRTGSRCKFWLPKKKRTCANTPLHDSLFCGNHSTRSEVQWIPCPIDPSHSVMQENLEKHLTKCPFMKQVRSLSAQPFYQKGINSCGDDEEGDDTKPTEALTSEMKRNAVYSMTVAHFSKLIGKIKSIHSSICKEFRDSYKSPEACGMWINREVDGKLPFQEKHVLQQASILGNLEEFGLLENSDVPAVVEFGAGRGYLAQMLADSYGIKRVFLVERRSYKLKADRSLRKEDNLILERLRIDIEDLNLNAVESLRGVSYLATGKHLCGPATDMTLRCCLRAGSDRLNGPQSNVSGSLKGIAIATCCHHLCQWKHYINKRYFENLGIAGEDFHAITWFTSWAVDADHDINLSDVDCGLHLQIIEDLCDNLGGVEEIIKNTRAVERAVLGFMCKDIIDAGRMMWLKEEHGLETQLVKYVPCNISPENHLLIAKVKNN